MRAGFITAADGNGHVVPTHDPRDQQDGFGGVVYLFTVGWECYKDAVASLGSEHRNRIAFYSGLCDERCQWCGGE